MRPDNQTRPMGQKWPLYTTASDAQRVTLSQKTYTVCHVTDDTRMAAVCHVSELSVALTAAHSLVLDVPVLLLALDAAITGVPAAVIHRLLLTVIALSHKTHFTHLRH